MTIAEAIRMTEKNLKGMSIDSLSELVGNITSMLAEATTKVAKEKLKKLRGLAIMELGSREPEPAKVVENSPKPATKKPGRKPASKKDSAPGKDSAEKPKKPAAKPASAKADKQEKAEEKAEKPAKPAKPAGKPQIKAEAKVDVDSIFPAEVSYGEVVLVPAKINKIKELSQLAKSQMTFILMWEGRKELTACGILHVAKDNIITVDLTVHKNRAVEFKPSFILNGEYVTEDEGNLPDLHYSQKAGKTSGNQRTGSKT